MRFQNLNTTYRKETTVGGYSFSNLKSALQKAIRRNDVERTLRILFEIDQFYLVWLEAKPILTNFYHRLLIILLEDIGAPNVNIFSIVNETLHYLFDMRRVINTNHACIDSIHHRVKLYEKLVYHFSKCDRSREGSHFRFVYHQLPNIDHCETICKHFPKIALLLKECKSKKEIPKNKLIFGKDQSTILEHFIKDSECFQDLLQFLSLLERKSDTSVYFAFKIMDKKVNGRYFKKSSAATMILYALYVATEDIYFMDIISVCADIFIEICNTEEAFLCWLVPVIAWIRGYQLEQLRDEVDWGVDVLRIYDSSINWEGGMATPGSIIKFEEWDLDMHTLIGKSRGKDGAYFAKEGCKVFPEDEKVDKDYFYAYAMNKYLFSGKSTSDFFKDFPQANQLVYFDEDRMVRPGEDRPGEDEKCEESDEELYIIQPDEYENKYTFLVRAQLNTNNGRPDTYFGMMNNIIYFIKGPFISPDTVDIVYKNNYVKTFFQGLNMLNIEVESLYPDLSIKSGLGIRNKCKDSEKQYFLVFKDLAGFTDINLIPIVEKSSPKWPITKVVDWSKVTDCSYVCEKDLFDDEVCKQYILTLLFRFVVGISDTCIRNVLYKKSEKKIYSVDEMDQDTNFGFKVASVIRKKILDYLQKHSEHIIDIVKEWEMSVITSIDQVMKYILNFDTFFDRLKSIKDIEFVKKILN